jgi:RNA polymerase sigma factor (sigma-70 family)
MLARSDFLGQLQELVASGETVGVLRSAHRSCDRHLSCDDFDQMVLLRAIQNASSFRGQSKPELLGWLKAIGQQLAGKLRRVTGPASQSLPAESREQVRRSEAEEISHEAVQAAKMRWLSSVLADLSIRDQVLLRRRYWCHESLVVIAREFGVSADTLRQRWFRLHQRLRALGRLRRDEEE